jgi:N-methylhydantoinase B
MDMAVSQQDINPINLEIIRTSLQSVPDLIEADLMRTAYSPLIYEYKDYAVGLVDAQGRSISLATRGLPGFLTNVLGLAVRDGLEIYGKDGIQPGDVILSNHAGTMGQHLNNVIMYTPVFGPTGRLLAFMAVNVHWIDIGGTYPGSCIGTDTTELVQEGLQLRTVKLFRRGELVEEVLRIIQYNTRLPEMLLGDLWAQHASCVKGRQLFEQLTARFGEDVLLSGIAQIWRNSEAAARAAVRAVPDGIYEASSFLDDDGIDRGKRIRVHVKVQIRDSDFIVDYSGCSEEVRGPFNSGAQGGAAASAHIAFKYLFTPNEPTNEGALAPVTIIIPPGKFLSASANAPLGLYQTPLSTVVDTIIAAMATVLPDRVAAGHHGAADVHGFNGTNPLTGRFYSFFDTAHGGWGGSSRGDGVGPYKTIRHADNKDIPVETVEALYPIVVERHAWRTDSGGPGQHRGGLGVDKTLRVLAPCYFTIAYERFHCPPWGLHQGLPGDPAHAEVESADGKRRAVLKESRLPLKTGDRVHLHTGAGGGYGAPTARDPESVRLDVLRGYVSKERAHDIYRVAIDVKGEVDGPATEALRNHRAA